MMYNFFLAIYKDNKETAISKYHNLALLQSYEILQLWSQFIFPNEIKIVI